MREHKTKQQKKARMKAYKRLRRIGVPYKLAVRYMDWTDNKIEMIVTGQSLPTDLFLFVQNGGVLKYV
jgi:hypothetical protein